MKLDFMKDTVKDVNYNVNVFRYRCYVYAWIKFYIIYRATIKCIKFSVACVSLANANFAFSPFPRGGWELGPSRQPEPR